MRLTQGYAQVCTSVGYTITASLAMSGIHRAICYRNHPGIRCSRSSQPCAALHTTCLDA